MTNNTPLPVEILHAIFNDTSHPDIIHYAWISQNWRAAAVTHSQFFRTISLDTRTPFPTGDVRFRRWTSRLSDITEPLLLSITLDPLSAFSRETLQTGSAQTAFSSFLTTLTAAVPFLRRLELALHEGPFVLPILRAMSGPACAAPILESVTISCQVALRSTGLTPSAWPADLFGQYAPRLANLNLLNSGVAFPDPVLPIFGKVKKLGLTSLAGEQQYHSILCTHFPEIASASFFDCALGSPDPWVEFAQPQKTLVRLNIRNARGNTSTSLAAVLRTVDLKLVPNVALTGLEALTKNDDLVHTLLTVILSGLPERLALLPGEYNRTLLTGAPGSVHDVQSTQSVVRDIEKRALSRVLEHVYHRIVHFDALPATLDALIRSGSNVPHLAAIILRLNRRSRNVWPVEIEDRWTLHRTSPVFDRVRCPALKSVTLRFEEPRDAEDFLLVPLTNIERLATDLGLSGMSVEPLLILERVELHLRHGAPMPGFRDVATLQIAST
ncbi:hypothetical protein BKA62DRAFT_715250 [Auriculariales sp. MPI-PUGE-AT-0066]|nr:hypothetical protein BKA62DRAFT_715250 [Auriculariales sp. MPI-PUGE-AT-0066]